jgi:hypothetical protein
MCILITGSEEAAVLLSSLVSQILSWHLGKASLGEETGLPVEDVRPLLSLPEG